MNGWQIQYIIFKQELSYFGTSCNRLVLYYLREMYLLSVIVQCTTLVLLLTQPVFLNTNSLCFIEIQWINSIFHPSDFRWNNSFQRWRNYIWIRQFMFTSWPWSLWNGLWRYFIFQLFLCNELNFMSNQNEGTRTEGNCTESVAFKELQRNHPVELLLNERNMCEVLSQHGEQKLDMRYSSDIHSKQTDSFEQIHFRISIIISRKRIKLEPCLRWNESEERWRSCGMIFVHFLQ